MDKPQSKCKTCKHLHAIMSYGEKGLKGDYVCTANDKGWVKVDRLYTCDDFESCADYEHFDELRIKDNSNIEIKHYDYNEGCRKDDCVNCHYFWTYPMLDPGGYCMARGDKMVGLGDYCELFKERGTAPSMNTLATIDMQGVQKLAIQFEMLLEEKDGEEDEK